MQVAAISYAVAKLRSSNSDWAESVLTVLPILVFPGLAILCYWTIQRVAKMCKQHLQQLVPLMISSINNTLLYFWSMDWVSLMLFLGSRVDLGCVL